MATSMLRLRRARRAGKVVKGQLEASSEVGRRPGSRVWAVPGSIDRVGAGHRPAREITFRGFSKGVGLKDLAS